MGANTGGDIRLCQLFDDGDTRGCEIHFDRGRFLRTVRQSIRVLAVDRCYEMLEKREGRANILDHDYRPPSPSSSE